MFGGDRGDPRILSRFEAEFGGDSDDPVDEVLLFGEEPESPDLSKSVFGLSPMVVSDEEVEEVSRAEREARDPIGRVSGAQKKNSKAKGGRPQRSEYFTFTLWLGLTEVEALEELESFKKNLARLKAEKLVGFHACGHELAPKTGRHHVQGYLETFSHDVRWSYETFKAEVFKLQRRGEGDEVKCFVTSSKGSAEDNKKYTQKDDDLGRWFVVDESVPYRNYGRGNQLGRVKAVLDSGASLLATAQTAGCFDAVIRYRSSLMWYENAISKPRCAPTRFTWIHGPSGAGKSQWALKQYPPSTECYWMPPSKNGNVWWDKYNKHKVVVIDEMKPHTFGLGHAGFAYAQRIFDSTPLQVGVHGSMTEFVADRVIITANFPMSEWFPKEFCGYDWDVSNPLFRRLRDFGTEVLFGTEDPDYERPSRGPAGSGGVSANFVAAEGDVDRLVFLVEGGGPPSTSPVKKKSKGHRKPFSNRK